MALKKCKECKQKISTKAKTCPHCGAPQKRTLSGCSKLFLILIILFLLFVVIGVSQNPGSKSIKTAPTPEPTKSREQAKAAPTPKPTKTQKQAEVAPTPQPTQPLEQAKATPTSQPTKIQEHFENFRLVDEDVYDSSIKSQIMQYLVVLGEPTESELRDELEYRFQEAQKRGGFKNHRFATDIYIYLYGSEEQAKTEKGLWIAMLQKTPANETPYMAINEARFRTLTASQPQEQPDKIPTIKSTNSKAEKLGTWNDYVNEAWNWDLSIWREGESYYLILSSPKDGSKAEPKNLIKMNDKTFKRAGSMDYYKIESDGNLGLYDDEGFIRKARRR